MCGITGVLHFDNDRKVVGSILQKMTDVIRHRGPDGEGFFINDNIGLGHRRLSIIDLATGDQPMYNRDNSIALVFNGEIYNYVELREELRNYGIHFRTNSDTEVVIKAYEKWGVDCLNRLNGMWAFALWDDNKKELFLSRDRVGEKPLFYTVFDNSFVFGSEIKVLFKYGIPREPDLEFLELYLFLTNIPEPHSFFKGVKKLQAGHYIIVKDGIVSEKKYWDLPEIDEDNMLNDKREIYDKFEYLLKDSVKIRMRSDVPFGAFLSGGLDSSSIVALMAELSNYPVETFTIGFHEKAFDESRLAQEVSERFSTHHNHNYVVPDSFDEALNRAVFHYDEPFGDSSAIPTGYISKYARQRVKMVLTGDGGDEVLSGYNSYQGIKITSMYQKIPSFLRYTMPYLFSFISKPLRGNVRYKANRLVNVCKAANFDFNTRLMRKMPYINYETVGKLLGNRNKVLKIEDYITDFMNKTNYNDDFYRMMYWNFKQNLPNDYLVKVDRMSMAYSLEARIPFLDYRLIEFMAHVDRNVKMQGFERKSILRNTTGNKLPASLLNAPKKGFGVPLREWFKGNIFEQRFKNMSIDKLLDKRTLEDVFRKNLIGKVDHGNFIWGLLFLDKVLGGGC
jgi:asparagine synthase (glutamine-hydrolysing)